MGLGQKQKYTGIIRLQHVGGSSKSGRETHVLDTGDGNPVPLRLKNGNAMRDPAFDPFVNMRVSLEGVALSGLHALIVDDVKDIVLLGPPGRPSHPPARPPQPKP